VLALRDEKWPGGDLPARGAAVVKLVDAVLQAFEAGAEIARPLAHPFYLAPGPWESSLSPEASLELLAAAPQAMDRVLSWTQGLIEEGYLYRHELDRARALGQAVDPQWKAMIEKDLDFFMAMLGHDLSAWAIERVLQIRHERLRAERA
jgi:hypothetical protein